MAKHLIEQGQMWHRYLSLAMFVYNIFNSPNLCNHSPYELVFGRRPKILLDLETEPDIKVSGSYKEYFMLLNKKATVATEFVANFQNEMFGTYQQGQGLFSV